MCKDPREQETMSSIKACRQSKRRRGGEEEGSVTQFELYLPTVDKTVFFRNFACNLTATLDLNCPLVHKSWACCCLHTREKTYS